MPIKKEYIHSGMRLTHPSGVTTTAQLQALKELKVYNQNLLSFLQGQVTQLEKDIAEIEALQKK
jgi:hypothetical protein